MGNDITFDLKPLTFDDLPEIGSDEFNAFLDRYFAAGERLANSMDEWSDCGKKENGTVQMRSISTGGSQSKLRKSIGISEYWCGRVSTHDTESLKPYGPDAEAEGGGLSLSPVKLVRRLSKRLSSDGRESRENRRPSADLSEVDRQARVMSSRPQGIYEHFRKGLLEYHSANEREYIEACREIECLSVLVPHVAEVWRMTYVTPPPTSPRTFVNLLLSRELKVTPHGERCFMNIQIPFKHPDCPEKAGSEKSRVRGKYVSVELVREIEGGRRAEWRMATSSDAGGNIPRFMTNSSLPKNVAEDVPSFLRWMTRKYASHADDDVTAANTARNGEAPNGAATA